MRGPAILMSVLVALVPGCAEDTGSGEPSWRVSGSFTEDAGDEDIADLQQRLRPWGTSAAILESYPLQYSILVDSGPACDEVRTMLQQRAYLASVGRCQAVAAGP